MLADLLEKLITFECVANYPVSHFNEDEQSLNGALTAVAIMVPQHFYAAEYNPRTGEYDYSNPDKNMFLSYPEGSSEYVFVRLLKSFRLA